MNMRQIRLVVCFVLVCAGYALAQLSAGVNVSYRLQSTLTTSSDLLPQGTNAYSSTMMLSIRPYCAITVNQFVTIAPLLEWSLQTMGTGEQDDVLTDQMSVAQNSLAIGGELLCTVLRLGNIVLAMGPEVGYRFYGTPGVSKTSFSTIDTGAYNFSSYYKHDLWLGFPLAFDCYLNRRLAIRISADILRFTYSFVKYSRPIDALPYSAHDFDVSFTTLLSPAAGFLIAF